MKFEPKNILKAMTADKKKFGLMLGLLCVGLLLWGRLLIKDVPRTADAEGLASVTATAITPTAKAPAGSPVIELILASAPLRDPFSIDDQGYAKVQHAKPVEVVQKSAPKPADEPDIKSLVLKAAANLKLQSTMLGEKPRALINGEVVAPGQRVHGFILKEIRNRQAVLEKNGIEIVLDM